MGFAGLAKAAGTKTAMKTKAAGRKVGGKIKDSPKFKAAEKSFHTLSTRGKAKLKDLEDKAKHAKGKVKEAIEKQEAKLKKDLDKLKKDEKKFKKTGDDAPLKADEALIEKDSKWSTGAKAAAWIGGTALAAGGIYEYTKAVGGIGAPDNPFDMGIPDPGTTPDGTTPDYSSYFPTVPLGGDPSIPGGDPSIPGGLDPTTVLANLTPEQKQALLAQLQGGGSVLGTGTPDLGFGDWGNLGQPPLQYTE